MLCSPGRFFVAHELKLLFAYVFMNYEVMPLEEKPQYKWIGRTGVPPMHATIQVKRRPGPDALKA